MAILADLIYTAEPDGVDSMEALTDPFNPNITFRDAMLSLPSYMNGVLTDTHFRERDRMGRAITFLARSFLEGLGAQKAICADEGTAFCIENSGVGKVFGSGDVYFLKANVSTWV